MRPRYYHQVIGINSRFDSMQAAVLNAKIQYLDDAVAGRQKNAQLYTKLLQESGLQNRSQHQFRNTGTGMFGISLQFESMMASVMT